MTAIHPDKKTVEVLNLKTGESSTVSYDKLIFSTGALPVIPAPFATALDAGNIFTVRTIRDAVKIRTFITESKPERAVIIGAD
ncbi:FAD-dependent oxidoreductase [Brucepastera parasyntrophica]|uniref:FAD-dependent oxidoreductase n=1 Tax=Brucepastera parasyntrophica TaxID=2880008 RepID=UPI0034E2B93E